jgi:hypothetical protein
MRRRGPLACSIGLLATIAGCGGSPPPPPQAQPPAASAPAAPKGPQPRPAPPAGTTAQNPPAVPTSPKSQYDAKGRRDPFENPDVIFKEREKAAGGFTISSAKLTGIVRGQTTLALVETADGVGYIMKPGDTLGDGKLIEIGQDAAVFAVVPKPGSNTNRIVLKIVTE